MCADYSGRFAVEIGHAVERRHGYCIKGRCGQPRPVTGRGWLTPRCWG